MQRSGWRGSGTIPPLPALAGPPDTGRQPWPVTTRPQRRALPSAASLLLHAALLGSVMIFWGSAVVVPAPPEELAIGLQFVPGAPPAPTPSEGAPTPQPPLQSAPPAPTPPPTVEPSSKPPPPQSAPPVAPQPPPPAVEPPPELPQQPAPPVAVPAPPPVAEQAQEPTRPQSPASPHRAAPRPVVPKPSRQTPRHSPAAPQPAGPALPAAPSQPTTAAPVPAAPAPARVIIQVPPRLLGEMAGTCPGVYPPAAQRRGVQGRVIVRARISAEGMPEDATVATGSGSDQLDRAALEAVRTCRRFPRATAPYVAEIPYNFVLSN